MMSILTGGSYDEAKKKVRYSGVNNSIKLLKRCSFQPGVLCLESYVAQFLFLVPVSIRSDI